MRTSAAIFALILTISTNLIASGSEPESGAKDDTELTKLMGHFRRASDDEIFEELTREGNRLIEEMRENFDRDQIVNQKNPVMKERHMAEIMEIARASKYEREDAVALQQKMQDLRLVARMIEAAKKADQYHGLKLKKLAGGKLQKVKTREESDRPLPKETVAMLEDASKALETIRMNPSNWIGDVYEQDLKDAEAAVNKALRPPEIRLSSEKILEIIERTRALEGEKAMNSKIQTKRMSEIDQIHKLDQLKILPPDMREYLRKKIELLIKDKKGLNQSSMEVFETVEKKAPGANKKPEECTDAADAPGKETN